MGKGGFLRKPLPLVRVDPGSNTTTYTEIARPPRHMRRGQRPCAKNIGNGPFLYGMLWPHQGRPYEDRVRRTSAIVGGEIDVLDVGIWGP